MNAAHIPQKTICTAHSDWIIEQAKELKALLSYSDQIISLNRTRALSAINTAICSLRELQAYFEEV